MTERAPEPRVDPALAVLDVLLVVELPVFDVAEELDAVEPVVLSLVAALVA